MEIIKLNKYTNTGFLIKNVPEDGSDILFDMACSGDSNLQKELEKHGSSPERIKHIFITHFHADHYFADAAWELVQKNAIVYMEKSNWESYYTEPLVADLIHFNKKIEAAGKVILLNRRDKIKIGNYKIVWDNFDHANARNLAYRIDDFFVTGDAPLQDIFNEKSKFTNRLLCADNPVIKIAALNINQISVNDMIKRGESNERIKYLNNHTGTLENLETAMRKDFFKPFFMNLDVIIPHHLRCRPLDEMAEAITEKLNQIKKEYGYKYEIIF